MAALKFYDGAAWQTIGGVVPSGGFANLQTSQQSPGSSTSSTSGQMMGLAANASPALITPVVTGKIFVSVSGYLSQNTQAQNAGILLKRGLVSGGIPALLAATTGTTMGGGPAMSTVTGGALSVPFAIDALVIGLTLGQQIWFDLHVQVSGGGASVANVAFAAFEFP